MRKQKTAKNETKTIDEVEVVKGFFFSSFLSNYMHLINQTVIIFCLFVLFFIASREMQSFKTECVRLRRERGRERWSDNGARW